MSFTPLGIIPTVTGRDKVSGRKAFETCCSQECEARKRPGSSPLDQIYDQDLRSAAACYPAVYFTSGVKMSSRH